MGVEPGPVPRPAGKTKVIPAVLFWETYLPGVKNSMLKSGVDRLGHDRKPGIDDCRL